MNDNQFYYAKIEELMNSFRQVNRSMSNLMRIQGRELGLTPVQMRVLRLLYREPDLSLSELSNRLQLGCSTVSGVVKRMAEVGLIESRRLENNQRTIAMRLTPMGKELKEKVYGQGSLLMQALVKFVQLPEKHIDTLLKLHEELIEIMRLEENK